MYSIRTIVCNKNIGFMQWHVKYIFDNVYDEHNA